MSAKQKIRLYNSCVVSVLLDAAKTWGITQADKKRFDAFDSRCLGGISNVKWHHYVGNIEFQERTRKEKIMDFLTRKWLWWSDHLVSIERGWMVGEGLLSWVCSSWLSSPPWDSSKGWESQQKSPVGFHPSAKDGKASGQGLLLYFSSVENVVSTHGPGGDRCRGEQVNAKMEMKGTSLRDAVLQQEYWCE